MTHTHRIVPSALKLCKFPLVEPYDAVLGKTFTRCLLCGVLREVPVLATTKPVLRGEA
jgi:hypothetical protein